MAVYNTIIKKRNTTNDGWDSILPITLAENVLINESGGTVASHLADSATYIIGTTYDYTALNEAITRAKASKAKILNLGSNRTFDIGVNTVDFSGLIVEGNNVVIQGGGQTVVTVNGSIGDYTVLNADVARGDKSIDSALAASLVAGDLVKIISDADFSAAEVGRVQGEMHIVQGISGTVITFADTIFDAYTVLNNARVAKVTPTHFEISSGITIQNTGTGATDIGLYVTYAHTPKINCSFRQCGYASLIVEDCYCPKIDTVINDSSYTGTGTSYGVDIANATMYASTKGKIFYCRHCVAHGGNSNGGVAWESTVEVTAFADSAVTGNAVLDAHPSTGSVYWINCKVNNGNWGIKANAKYNYIRNCFGETKETSAEFVIVSSLADLTVDTLDIDGLTLSGYSFAVETNKPVTNLFCKNIRNTIHGIAIREAVTNWNFSGINTGQYGIAVYGTATSVPDTLLVNDSSSIYADTGLNGVYFIYNEATALTNIILDNCYQKRITCLLRSAVNLASLELYNCRSIEPFSAHLYASGLTVTRLVISGGNYSGNQQAGTTHGAILKGSATTASISNITTSGDNLDYIVYGTVTTLMHFGNSFHTLTAVIGASIPTEIIGGSVGYGQLSQLNGTAVWNPGSLADGVGETSAAITVTGAALGDYVLVSAPYDLQGITCNGYVSATDTVKIRLQNETTSVIDLASGTWKVRVIKS